MKGNNPEQWRSKLSAEQFHVCWEKGTERPYSGALLHNRKSGDYLLRLLQERTVRCGCQV